MEDLEIEFVPDEGQYTARDALEDAVDAVADMEGEYVDRDGFVDRLMSELADTIKFHAGSDHDFYAFVLPHEGAPNGALLVLDYDADEVSN